MILLLLACYGEPTFRRESDEAVCEWKATCFGDDLDACLATAEAANTEVDSRCEYDDQKAAECTNGLRELTCPNFDTGGGFDSGEEAAEFGFPSACDEVWSCAP